MKDFSSDMPYNPDALKKATEQHYKGFDHLLTPEEFLAWLSSPLESRRLNVIVWRLTPENRVLLKRGRMELYLPYAG